MIRNAMRFRSAIARSEATKTPSIINSRWATPRTAKAHYMGDCVYVIKACTHLDGVGLSKRHMYRCALCISLIYQVNTKPAHSRRRQKLSQSGDPRDSN